MENSEEKRLENDILNSNIISNISEADTISKNTLEEKIIQETYKAIETDENCKMIKIEYNKMNTLKSKIKRIVNKIHNLFSKLLSNNREKKNTKNEKLSIKTTKKTYDLDVESTKEVVNKRLLKKEKEFEEQNGNNIKGNSGPISYNFRESLENIATEKKIDNNVKNRRIEYIDLPNTDGKNRNSELEK